MKSIPVLPSPSKSVQAGCTKQEKVLAQTSNTLPTSFKKDLRHRERNYTPFNPGEYGSFIFKARQLALGHSSNSKNDLKKAQKFAKEDLKIYLRNFVEDSEIKQDAFAFEERFKKVKLNLEEELFTIFKSETNKTSKDNALKTLLALGNGTSWNIVKVLEKKDDESTFKYIVDFLQNLPVHDLYRFIYRISISSSPQNTSNLASSLLELTEGKYIVSTLLESAEGLVTEDRWIPKPVRDEFLLKTQMILLTAMEQVKPSEISAGDIEQIYKIALNKDLKARAAKLLITNFKDEAANIFWDVASDNEGIDFVSERFSKSLRYAQLRAKRLVALRDYIFCLKDKAIGNLRRFIQDESDPMIVQFTCGLLLTGIPCGRIGQKALVDVLDEDIRTKEASLGLAAVCWANVYKEPVLRKLFSKNINLEEAILKLEDAYLPRLAAITSMDSGLLQPGVKGLVEHIGLHNLVHWMNSKNKRLRENAMNVFLYAGDEDIIQFLLSKRTEVSMLKEMVGVSPSIGDFRKVSEVQLLDKNKYGTFVLRIKYLILQANEQEEPTESRLVVLRNKAKKDFENSLEELAKDDTTVSSETDLLRDIFNKARLDFNQELIGRFNKTDSREETERKILLKMLLCNRAAYPIIDSLQTGENDPDYASCLKVLSSLKDEEMKTFLDDVIEHPDYGKEKINNLAHSLLQAINEKSLVSTLIEKINILREDENILEEERILRWRKLQRLLISVMEKAKPEDLEISDVTEFYKKTTNYKIRKRTEELAIARFGEEAAPAFLSIVKDTRGITPLQIKKELTLSIKTHRDRRHDALDAYVTLLGKKSVSELRNILLNEKDPLIVQRICDWLTLIDQCGEKAPEALIDAIDETIRAGKTSSALASIATYVDYDSYQNAFHAVLERVLSIDCDFKEVFSNLNNAWVCKFNEAKYSITSRVEKPGTETIIRNITLGRLVKWMTSNNEILRRNAIQVFNLASDDDIRTFVKSESKEARQFKRLIGL